jgi:hypothetical protein
MGADISVPELRADQLGSTVMTRGGSGQRLASPWPAWREAAQIAGGMIAQSINRLSDVCR